MQTFLPYPDFVESARVLDNRRLNKQIVEVLQIHNALENGGGWRNHPAVKMWIGYEEFLLTYGSVCYDEWARRLRSGIRGGKSFHKSGDQIRRRIVESDRTDRPWWFGDARFHSAHRAALLFKDPIFYSKYGWAEIPGLNYYWPI